MTDFSNVEISRINLTQLKPGDQFPNYGFGGSKGGQGTIEITDDGAILHVGTLAPIKIKYLLPEEIQLYRQIKIDSILYPYGYITRVNPETGEEVKIGKQYLPALQGFSDDDMKRMCIRNQVELPKELQPKRRPPFTPFEFGIDCRLIAALIKRRGHKSIGPFFDEVRKISIDLREKSNYKITPNDAIDLARNIIQKNDIPFTTYVITYASLLGKNDFLNKQAIQELALEKMSLVSYLVKEAKEKEEKLKRNTLKKEVNNKLNYLPNHLKPKNLKEGKNDDKMIMIQTNIPSIEEEFYGSSLAYGLFLDSFLMQMNEEQKEVFLTTIVSILTQIIPEEILNTIPNFDKNRFMPSKTKMTEKQKEFADKVSFEILKMSAEIILAPLFSKLTKEGIEEIFHDSLQEYKGEGGGFLQKMAALAGIGYGTTQGALASSSSSQVGFPSSSSTQMAPISQGQQLQFARNFSRLASDLGTMSSALSQVTYTPNGDGNGTFQIYELSEVFSTTADKVKLQDPVFQNWLIFQHISEFFRSFGANEEIVPFTGDIQTYTTGTNLQSKVKQNKKGNRKITIDQKAIDSEAERLAEQELEEFKRKLALQIQTRKIDDAIWSKYFKQDYDEELQRRIELANIDKRDQLKKEKLNDIRDKLNAYLQIGDTDDDDFKQFFPDYQSIYQLELDGLIAEKKANIYQKEYRTWSPTVRNLRIDELAVLQKEARIRALNKLKESMDDDDYLKAKIKYLSTKNDGYFKKTKDIVVSIKSYFFGPSNSTKVLTALELENLTQELNDEYYENIQGLLGNVYKKFYQDRLSINNDELTEEAKQQQRVISQFGNRINDKEGIDSLINENSEIITFELFILKSKGLEEYVSLAGKFIQKWFAGKGYADSSNLEFVRIFIKDKKTGKKSFFTLTYSNLHKLQRLVSKTFLEKQQTRNLSSLSPLEKEVVEAIFKEISKMPIDILLKLTFDIRPPGISGELNELINLIQTGDTIKVYNLILSTSNRILSQASQIQQQAIAGQLPTSSTDIITLNENPGVIASAAVNYAKAVKSATNLMVNNGAASFFQQVHTEKQLTALFESIKNNKGLQANYPAAVEEALIAYGNARKLAGQVVNATGTAINAVESGFKMFGISFTRFGDLLESPAGPYIILALLFTVIIVFGQGVSGPFSLLKSGTSGIFGLFKAAFDRLPGRRTPAPAGSNNKGKQTPATPAPAGSNNKRGEAAAPTGSNNRRGEAAPAGTPVPATTGRPRSGTLNANNTQAQTQAATGTPASGRSSRSQLSLNAGEGLLNLSKTPPPQPPPEALAAAAAASGTQTKVNGTTGQEFANETQGGGARKRKTRRALKRSRRTLRKKR